MRVTTSESKKSESFYIAKSYTNAWTKALQDHQKVGALRWTPYAGKLEAVISLSMI